MLIPLSTLPISKKITGVLHIGAHECEERHDYMKILKLSDSDILWIEANGDKVTQIKNMFPDVIIKNECIGEIDDKFVTFIFTNNSQSNSILNLSLHSKEHPWVIETHREIKKTKTINTIFAENNFDACKYNFLNIDIQGAELLALKGSTNILPFVDYIYTEVNVKELYENCALLHEIDEFLVDFGFQRVKTELTQHGWGDAFYSRVR